MAGPGSGPERLLGPAAVLQDVPEACVATLGVGLPELDFVRDQVVVERFSASTLTRGQRPRP